MRPYVRRIFRIHKYEASHWNGYLGVVLNHGRAQRLIRRFRRHAGVLDFLKEKAMKCLPAGTVVGWMTPAIPYGAELVTRGMPRRASLDIGRLYRVERKVGGIRMVSVVVDE